MGNALYVETRRQSPSSFLSKSVHFKDDANTRVLFQFPYGMYYNQDGQLNALVKEVYYAHEYGEGFFPTVLYYRDENENFNRIYCEEIVSLFEYGCKPPNIYVTTNGVILIWEENYVGSTICFQNFFCNQIVSAFTDAYQIRGFFQEGGVDYVNATSKTTKENKILKVVSTINLGTGISKLEFFPAW